MISNNDLQTIKQQFETDSLSRTSEITVGGDNPHLLSMQNKFISDIINISNNKLYLSDKIEKQDFEFVKINTKYNSILFDYDVIKIKTPLFIKQVLYSCHNRLQNIDVLPIKIILHISENCPVCTKTMDNLISYTVETGEGIDIDILNIDKIDKTKYTVMSSPFIVIRNLENGNENCMVGLYNNSVIRNKIYDLIGEG